MCTMSMSTSGLFTHTPHSCTTCSWSDKNLSPKLPAHGTSHTGKDPEKAVPLLRIKVAGASGGEQGCPARPLTRRWMGRQSCFPAFDAGPPPASLGTRLHPLPPCREHQPHWAGSRAAPAFLVRASWGGHSERKERERERHGEEGLCAPAPEFL